MKIAAVKRCSGCKRDLSLSEFYRDRRQRSGLTCRCRDCIDRADRERAAANPERRQAIAARARRRYQLKRYGLTEHTYQTLLEQQGGTCAICPSTEDLVVDHDHLVGGFRGILCQGCNIGLGGFRDDPDRLLAAIAYLQRATEVARCA